MMQSEKPIKKVGLMKGSMTMSNIKHTIEEIVGHTPILELDGLEKKNNWMHIF